MTELQLKIMERADKTLNKWCEVIIMPQDEYGDDIYYTMCKWDERPLDQITNIIWLPYWFERILYLHWQKLPPNDSQQSINFQNIIDYIKQRNQKPLLEKCIDWDEEWQQIILDFLLSLPK